jgi:hypothetical protein
MSKEEVRQRVKVIIESDSSTDVKWARIHSVYDKLNFEYSASLIKENQELKANFHASERFRIEDAMSAINEINELKAKVRELEWISVEERLPKKDGNSQIMCLVIDSYHGIVVRPYNEYHKCWDDEGCDDYYTDAVGGKITHWMPLPSPPTK